jgi:ATP-binding cassette subfamily B multidrug efflux pump
MLKIYKFLKPYAASVTAIIILVFIQVMSDLYLPTLMSDIVNKGILGENVSYIMRTGGLMLLVAAGGVACAVLSSLLGSRASIGLGRILRSKVFGRVESFSLSEFDKFGASTLITRTTNDIIQIQTTTILIINMMIRAPLMAAGGTILAFSKDPGMTPVLAVALPLLAAIIVVIAKFGTPLFRSIQKKIDRINLIMRENLTGMRVIRAFDRGDYEEKRFDEASRDLTDTYIRVNRIVAFMIPAMMLVMNIVTLSIIWFGSMRIGDGSTNLGNLLAFMQYAMQILFSLLMFAAMFIMIPRAQAAADRINEVLAAHPQITDPENPISSGEAKGYVEFKDVSFSYPGAEQPVISGVSFLARPGETTAIIGGTGSGKSTVINLIPRFYDVTSGQVLIDGVDVRAMTQSQLRAKIGYVPQKAILFTGSIKDNLRYGRADADDLEIKRACITAQADDFISEFSDGYDTVLSEGGLNLSGGQKQRLSIARALVRRPEIYVFDDSFSALDFTTDAKLRTALRKETMESTVIIVAQRVGTVMNADRIIVLDEGRVAGIGTHTQLMESCEVYREIVSSQLSEEELK